MEYSREGEIFRMDVCRAREGRFLPDSVESSNRSFESNLNVRII